jgi:hypothetical protein
MKRLFEVILILVFIIVLSVVFSSIKKEPFSQIDSISNDLSMSGLNAIAGSPLNNVIRPFINLVPTFNDLLATGYIKSDLTRNLGGFDNIMARTCNDVNVGDETSLLSMSNSNKTGCQIMVDLQKYKFMSRDVGSLNIYANSTTSTLSVVPDEVLKTLLLYRPAFIVFEATSRPYMLNFAGMNPFLFSTQNISNVDVYNRINTTRFNLPIREINRTNRNFFGSLSQGQDIITLLRSKKKRIDATTDDSNNIISMKATIFYLKIDSSFGNSLELQDGISMGYITRVDNNNNMTINNYLATTLMSYGTLPKAPLRDIDLRNPTLSVQFSIYVGKPNTLSKWMNNWIHVLKVGGERNNGSCELTGRGILLVEMKPSSERRVSRWGNPYVERRDLNTDYVCLDFTNVEVDAISNRIVSSGECGGQNRATLWIPTGVKVDIAYIVSATMKVVVASYFDKEKGERQMTFHQVYHNGTVVNAIKTTIQTLKTLVVQNLFMANNSLDPNEFKLSNVKLSYGMMDLNNWYNSM